MKHLSLLLIATLSTALSLTLQAQTSASANAAAQATTPAASAAASAQLSAELTQKLNTKNTQVGDQVVARTTSSAQLADGTKLPKGTTLVGHVTDVQAKSSADSASHLAFSLDRAVMRDGREVPVHAMLTSLAVPSASASADASDDLMAGPVSAGGSTSARASSGGLLGGAAHATGSAVGSGGRLVGNTVGGVASTTGSALHTTAGVAGSGLQQLDHVAVAGLPGVTLSSSASAMTSGSLDATGRNIALDSGTQLTMNVSATTR